MTYSCFLCLKNFLGSNNETNEAENAQHIVELLKSAKEILTRQQATELSVAGRTAHKTW